MPMYKNPPTWKHGFKIMQNSIHCPMGDDHKPDSSHLLSIIVSLLPQHKAITSIIFIIIVRLGNSTTSLF